MTSALAWLFALPMQVVRLVRMLLQRLVHIGGHRSTPREHAMAELRRRYPDAPDVWLEVVARNMSSIGGGAGALSVDTALEIAPEQAIAVPHLAPVATIVEDENLRIAPSGRGSFGAGRPRLSTAAAEDGGVSPVRPRTLGHRRPRWRELETAAAPTRGSSSHAPMPAEALASHTPNQSSAFERRPIFSRPEQLDVRPVVWSSPGNESAVVPGKTPVVAPAVLTDDPWAAVPHGNGVHAMPRIAERPAGAERSPWSHVPDDDRWPALLPTAPLPRNAPVTPLSERIARLRAIQERL